jgi:hypothetical protein
MAIKHNENKVLIPLTKSISEAFRIMVMITGDRKRIEKEANDRLILCSCNSKVILFFFFGGSGI